MSKVNYWVDLGVGEPSAMFKLVVYLLFSSEIPLIDGLVIHRRHWANARISFTLGFSINNIFMICG